MARFEGDSMRSGYLLALVLAFLSAPLFAQSNDVGLWYSGAHLSTTTSTDGSDVKFSSAHGYAASYNHFWFGHFSTDFAYASLRSNGHIRVDGENVLDLGRLTTKVGTAIAQWHFHRGGFVDPYLGAGAAYVKAGTLNSSDLDQSSIGQITIDKKWGWAANAGVNLNLGHNLALAIDDKYVPYKPSSTSAGSSLKLKLNPNILSAGVRFRF
jgi:outer membrane protein W